MSRAKAELVQDTRGFVSNLFTRIEDGKSVVYKNVASQLAIELKKIGLKLSDIVNEKELQRYLIEDSCLNPSGVVQYRDAILAAIDGSSPEPPNALSFSPSNNPPNAPSTSHATS